LIGTNVKLNVNLNKLLCFRNEEKKENLYNDGSSYKEEIGNVKLETEKYFEYKFKKAWKIADMTDVDIEKVEKLNFQCVIEYKNKDKENIIRVINETQTICRIQKDIEKNINYDIISTNAMQRSGKLAKLGKYKEAQIESLRWKTYMRNNVNSNNKNVVENYNMFKNNMRSVQTNLNDIRTEIIKKKSTNLDTQDEIQEQFHNASYKSRKQNMNIFRKKKK
jgi:hypothetical protein